MANNFYKIAFIFTCMCLGLFLTNATANSDESDIARGREFRPPDRPMQYQHPAYHPYQPAQTYHPAAREDLNRAAEANAFENGASLGGAAGTAYPDYPAYPTTIYPTNPTNPPSNTINVNTVPAQQ